MSFSQSIKTESQERIPHLYKLPEGTYECSFYTLKEVKDKAGGKNYVLEVHIPSNPTDSEGAANLFRAQFFNTAGAGFVAERAKKDIGQFMGAWVRGMGYDVSDKIVDAVAANAQQKESPLIGCPLRFTRVNKVKDGKTFANVVWESVPTTSEAIAAARAGVLAGYAKQFPPAEVPALPPMPGAAAPF